MELEDRLMADEAHRWWWVFLVVGIIWLLIGMVVLRLDESSVKTVGYLIGVLFVLGALTELLIASGSTTGWKIFHYILAVIFIVGAFWSFINPQKSFFALASILGFILLFMGLMEIMAALATRDTDSMWGLRLAVGILEIVLAIWVSQRYYPARAALILIWVGFMAIFKGISQIALAFAVRRAGKDLAAA
jgi:uncharacterized membrane protein HdeD (DUF308 family)